MKRMIGPLPEAFRNWRTMMFVSITVAGLAGCGTQELTSIRPSSTITIDGLTRDWRESQAYLDKQSMFVSVANDDSSLYILVKTIDLRAQMKVLKLGLTMWISSTGDTKHRIGIHYPIGVEEPGIPVFASDTPPPSAESDRTKLIDSLTQLELIRPDEEPLPMNVNESRDVRVAVRDTSEMVVYEIRVPLRRSDSSYGIIGGGDTKIVIEAETGDILPLMLAQGGDDGPRRRETTGMIRNKGRQRRTPEMSQMAKINPLAEPIRFSIKVKLAP